MCTNHKLLRSMATGFKWTATKSKGMDLFAPVMT